MNTIATILEYLAIWTVLALPVCIATGTFIRRGMGGE